MRSVKALSFVLATLAAVTTAHAERRSAKRLNQLDFASIAAGLNPSTLERIRFSGERRVFIDKTGKPFTYGAPRDKTGGRYVLVRPTADKGTKEIVVLGAQGKSGKSRGQVTQSEYLLTPGSNRPLFQRAVTTNRTPSKAGISVMRLVHREVTGHQSSSTSAFKLGGPRHEKQWSYDRPTSLGGKVPSMRALTKRAQQAHAKSQRPSLPARLLRRLNIR